MTLSSQPPPNRRELSRTVAFLIASCIGGVAWAANKVPATGKNYADMLTKMIRARYGKYLSKDQLKYIQIGAQRQEARAAALRKVPLSNAEGPAPIFRADLA
jgi:hypothetical protein